MKHMKKNGFTIFFAVLVASLALAVGLAIYDLLLRELSLSQTATQSQFAIYAADTGAECALYWDQKYINGGTNNNGGSGGAFATSSLDTLAASSGIFCTVQSNGVSQDISAQGTPPVAGFGLPPTSWTAWTITSTASAATTTFTIVLGSNATSSCAVVTVGKSGNPSQTSVVSHGYNTCSSSGMVRIERALQVNY